MGTMTLMMVLIAALGTAAGEEGADDTAAAPLLRHEAWPVDMDCPYSAPIKGNLTTHSGEYCIYHVPSGAHYRQTRPERCFVSEQDAVQAGCRRSRE